MSESVRSVATSRMRKLFFTLTSNRFSCLFSGVVLSIIVQSASAGTVFVFVLMRAGLINPFQALNLLGGVILGSSLILQLNINSYSVIAPLLIFCGVLIKFFSRQRRIANYGDLLIGVGLLFLGLTLLENSYASINNRPLYVQFDQLFYRTSFRAAIFGAILSFLVQSSHTVLSVVVSLLPTSKLTVLLGSYMVVGSLAGVTFSGALAAIGGGRASRFVVFILLVVTTFAALTLILLVKYSPLFVAIQHISQNSIYHSFSIIHLLCAFLAAMLCTVASSFFSRWLVKGELRSFSSVDPPNLYAGYLDIRILSTPALALEQSRKELHRMIRSVLFMYSDLLLVMSNYDARRADAIRQNEQLLDSLNHEITSFLIHLSRIMTPLEQRLDISRMLQIVSALEHIGDRCEEILDSIVAKKESGIFFSDQGMTSSLELASKVFEIVSLLESNMLEGISCKPENIFAIKEEISLAFDKARKEHFIRISSGVCSPEATMFFNDMTSALNRIAEEVCSILEGENE